MLGLVACGIVVGEVVDGDSDGDPGPGAAGSLPLLGMQAESAPSAMTERNAYRMMGMFTIVLPDDSPIVLTGETPTDR